MSNEKWIKAPQSVIDLAEELIAEFHEPLQGANIGFIFRETWETSGGKRVLGKASKVSPSDKVFSNLDFKIWIAGDYWLGEATELQRRALLDHELCHCTFDEDTETWKLRSHDIEEFQEIINRYGFWSDNLRMASGTFAKALQDTLPGFSLSRGRGSLFALDPEAMEE